MRSLRVGNWGPVLPVLMLALWSTSCGQMQEAEKTSAIAGRYEADLKLFERDLADAIRQRRQDGWRWVHATHEERVALETEDPDRWPPRLVYQPEPGDPPWSENRVRDCVRDWTPRRVTLVLGPDGTFSFSAYGYDLKVARGSWRTAAGKLFLTVTHHAELHDAPEEHLPEHWKWKGLPPEAQYDAVYPLKGGEILFKHSFSLGVVLTLRRH